MIPPPPAPLSAQELVDVEHEVERDLAGVLSFRNASRAVVITRLLATVRALQQRIEELEIRIGL